MCGLLIVEQTDCHNTVERQNDTDLSDTTKWQNDMDVSDTTKWLDETDLSEHPDMEVRGKVCLQPFLVMCIVFHPCTNAAVCA